jgi:DNA-directed RNA polymerase I subunit RPA2
MSFHTVEYVQEAINPTKTLPDLQAISKPHIESFDSLFESNLLDLAVNNILPMTVFDSKDIDGRNKLVMWLSNPTVGKPIVEGKGSRVNLLYPSECRERGVSYKAKMQIKVNYSINGQTHSETRSFGYLPVMVKV